MKISLTIKQSDGTYHIHMTEEFNQACRLQLSDVKNKMWVIFSYQHYQCRQNKFHEAVTSLMPDLPAQQKVSDDSHIANHTF